MNRSLAESLLLLALLLLSWPAHAESADRNKPIKLEADTLVVDETKQVSTFTGRVRLSQGTLLIRADKLVITQSADNQSVAVANGVPASFRQKRDGVNEYVEGYADRIDYDTRSDTVDMYGNARLRRDQDEVRGAHISYNARTEIFQVHGQSAAQPSNTSEPGRVRVVIQPKRKETAAPQE